MLENIFPKCYYDNIVERCFDASNSRFHKRYNCLYNTILITHKTEIHIDCLVYAWLIYLKKQILLNYLYILFIFIHNKKKNNNILYEAINEDINEFLM